MSRPKLALACLLAVAAVLGPAASLAATPINDVVPLGPHSYPADYGPDLEADFSPFWVPGDHLKLVLNVAARRLYVYQDGELAIVYPTAVGRWDHHTPIGDYSILSKAVYPTWQPLDGRPPVGPGPDNPLGSRWMCWLGTGYGLHGTNAEWSIGHAVSHGCVRMHNSDVEKLFEIVRIGTPLKVVYEPVELAPYPPDGLVLALYPDIYSRIPDYRVFLDGKLDRAGRAVDLDLLAWLIEATVKYGAAGVDTATPVFIGTHRLATPAVSVGDAPAAPLVSVRAVAGALGLAVGWDAGLAQPTIDGRPVPAVIAAGKAYASIADLAVALETYLDVVYEDYAPPAEQVEGEGQAEGTASPVLAWHKLTVYLGLVWVDGVVVARQAFRADDGTYIPLRAVAQALGLPLQWSAAAGVTLGGLAVPVRIVEGRSYVSPDVLATYLSGLATVASSPDGVIIARAGR